MVSDVLSEMIRDVEVLDDDIASLEEDIKKLKDERDRILQDDIPTYLHEEGLSFAPLSDGRTVTIEQVINVSQKDKNLLWEWLEEYGYDSIIKTEYIFPKGSDTTEFDEFLEESGIDYEKEPVIHPMTLKATIQEHIDSGGILPPLEAANVSIFERAKIKGVK